MKGCAVAKNYKVIIVQPRYQINLGYIARVSKNFGIGRLFLVNPRTQIGKRAIMFSKHARDLLDNAVICKDISSAISDCDIVVGTTGILHKGAQASGRAYSADEAVIRLSKLRGSKTIGILIGRDDTGLTKDELGRCGMVVHIPTNPDYPVLNISHALGILLYLLNSNGLKPLPKEFHARRAPRKETEHLFSLFDSLTENKRIRNKKTVRRVFRRLIFTSQPSEQEIHALITALK
jgi:TrmH family RNA methyltransferase